MGDSGQRGDAGPDTGGRVIPRWEAFMACWPTPTACARAPLGDLISAWTGLGYNRRAVFLHRTAVQLVERHGGVVPADERALLALPGVGSYTARAVLAFAFDRPVGVIDTNAARVLARAVAGRRLAPAGSPRTGGPAGAAPDVVGMESGHARSGCHRVHGAQPACQSCPLGPRSPRRSDRPTGLRLGGSRRPRPRGPARPAPLGPSRSSPGQTARVGVACWPTSPRPQSGLGRSTPG